MVAAKKSTSLNFFQSVACIGLLLLGQSQLSSCSKDSSTSSEARELRIYTWSDYLQEPMIKEFEKQHNARIKLDYFSSNEELLAKIHASVQSGSSGYDLVMPSDYMVHTMVGLKLVAELDHAKLPFIAEYGAQFQNPAYDPGLKHSVPVAWGTTGVAVNTEKAKSFNAAEGISWRDFFENAKYAGQVTFLDDMKEVFHSALLVLGKKWTEASKDDIKAAFEYIRKHKKNIRAFTAESRPVMEAGECVLCQAYSGDAMRAQKTRPNLQYVIPKEGATLWTDNFAIPKNAPNIEVAYKFLNFFLSYQEAKAFTEATFFASPNTKSRSLLLPELQSNSTIFPSDSDMARLGLIQEKPELMLVMDQYWTELRSE